MLERFTGVDVLVLDELHQRAGTEAESNILTAVVDARYRERLVTILVANASKSELAASVGDSIVSRIHESGEVVVAAWPTFRRPGQNVRSAEPRRPVADRRRTAPAPRMGQRDE